MPRRLKPLFDRVVIRMTEKPGMKGSLYVPEGAKEKPTEGTIIAVGWGTDREPMRLAVGDVVMFGRYSGSEVEFEGETLLVVKQGDVVTQIEEGE